MIAAAEGHTPIGCAGIAVIAVQRNPPADTPDACVIRRAEIGVAAGAVHGSVCASPGDPVAEVRGADIEVITIE